MFSIYVWCKFAVSMSNDKHRLNMWHQRLQLSFLVSEDVIGGLITSPLLMHFIHHHDVNACKFWVCTLWQKCRDIISFRHSKVPLAPIYPMQLELQN